MIVDDHPIFRQGLTELISRQQDLMVCGEAEDAPEAMRAIKRQKPDMVVTDIIMPDQDGIGTINELKKRYPEIKIIAISGGGRMLSKDYLGIAKILGADYTFTKPFDTKIFLKKVHELINLQESDNHYST